MRIAGRRGRRHAAQGYPPAGGIFFEDWGKIAAVLGDAASHDGKIEGGFLKRSVLKAPPGLEDGDDLPRFRWEIRSEDEGFDYKGLAEG